MACNYNYQPRGRGRPTSKRGPLKDIQNCRSRSSSDEEEFHSDDNLRPYEEVKVAHHDKKLDGLGIASPESVELSALTSRQPERKLNIQGGKNSNVYRYMETSDGEGDSDHNVSTNTGSLNVHNQGSQCSLSSNEMDNQNLKMCADVPRLTDSGVTSRLSDNYSHRSCFSHYPQACVPGTMPPCFAPPPPPIEDIPHRTAALPCRQRSFGPSNRGNYSDAETCLCRSPYADASTALLHNHAHTRGHYSDGEQYPQLRHCPCSGEESDFEPHYLEQTASGNVYIPDRSRYPETVPRSGSVPLSRSNEMVNSPLIRPQTSNTVPNHFMNGDHINQDRRFFHATFPCQQAVAISPSQHAGHDCGYYTKFSCSSHQMKKKLAARCSWKLTTFILVIVCVALLACALVFAASAYFQDKEKVAHSTSGALNDTQKVIKFTKPYTVFHIGQVKQSRIPPKTIWQTKFTQNQNKFVKFNFSLSRSAIISIYGRRYSPPTISQFDFFEVFNANHIGSRSSSSSNNRYKRSYVPEKDTALIHYMEQGEWYLSVYNDRDTPEYMSFKTDVLDTLGTDCPSDCHGHGDCVKGQCRCFPGYKGWDCSDYECPELCSRHGNFENGVCRCHKGWKGRECEIPEHKCEVMDCNGNGRCIEGKCVCRPGFRGPHCGLVTCLDPNCSGNGVCHLGRCVCYKGFKGANCNAPDKINVTQLCARDCSGHGRFDFEKGRCFCHRFFTGPDCEQEICRLECHHGHCQNQRCVCENGWAGVLCDQLSCDRRCDGLKGSCRNGTCICRKGWNGKHCTIDGCPNSCSNHGDCRGNGNEGWKCHCHTGWKGPACDQSVEQVCQDGKDDDRDGLTDCMDPDCCGSAICQDNAFCRSAPDPRQILLMTQPPSSTASFYEKMKFLVQDNSVQKDASRNAFNESQASVIRGMVVTKDNSPLIGVVVRVSSQPLYGYTLSRRDGMYDILVNGGGSVTLEFTRQPFQQTIVSVLVPWNQIVTMENIVMLLPRDQLFQPDPSLCGVMHDHYLLRPVVLSTWQHTKLGACSDKSTVIPESQVLQESIMIPGTDVHLVYHSSEAQGYKSVILIQLTPSLIPTNLALVHIEVSVQGVQFRKTFEADPGLKYTYSWDRENAYQQKVYGIVPATVRVGYQYTGCDYVFWEVRSTTMTGFDLKSSEVGGWNLDIHHTYNFQEGILHKGDGSNIYMRERPKELITILGTGDQRSLDCGTCNGLALNNRVHSPVALASGRDGSLYIWDLNFIRHLSPGRDDIASILEITTTHKPYMTVSPVDGRLYLSDMNHHRVIRVATMGPVRNLSQNYEVVAGDGEECTPGSMDECGDRGQAVRARLVHPKGIAISKEGVVYIADNLNIRKIDTNGIITTLIGSQGQLRAWEPMSCEDSQPASKARLQWPTDLAVDPVDNTLHILDKGVILKLTKDNYLVTIAGRPINCPIRSSHFMLSGVIRDEDEASGIAADVKLVNPQSIAFGSDGEIYIVESDTHSINRVRVVTSDGRIHHYAGKKSKCDCQTTCVCYNPEETLATQALFKELTSVSVTPDGVVHISDSGNLRIFSIISKLPEPDDYFQYKVFSPDTQEVYVFNKYGQHRHTVNIMSSQYMYNFTYNVNSFFGKLTKVSDDAGNHIEFIRDYEKVKEIISPDGLKSKLSMDNMKRLHQFTSPSNATTTFTYLQNEGLVDMKHLSNGLSYSYRYDDMGRLHEAKQPTGEVTHLSTDVNTNGSIVRVNTDGSDSLMMATYDSVQSVKRGPAETQLTYLPDGTVVMMFPTNLSISLESGGHPVLANQHRLHFKRKIIAPNKLIHKLEWRYYVRKRPNSQGVKVPKRLGNRMRVGAMLSSQHASMLESHDNLFDKGKVLLINGNNLLTVEYDREIHSEKIINNKNQQEILSITYDDSGLPVYFRPGNGHIPMNITYSQTGHITHWQYGEMYENLRYNAEGALQEKTLASNGQYRFVYRYSKSRPTDVVMPDGVQYTLDYSNQGDLVKVRTPDLGNHYFAKVTSIGIQRYLYWIPQRENPYCEEYDGNGKLLHVIYPSEQRRVIHRYNGYSQLSHILYDEAEIKYKYNPKTLQLMKAKLTDSEGTYECVEDFTYIGSLTSSYGVKLSKDDRMKSAKYSYTYDNNFRVVQIDADFGEGMNSTVTKYKYDETTGKLKSLYDFSATWILSDKEEITDGQLKITRGYDVYARQNAVTYSIKGTDVFVLKIQYDFMNRIQGWDSHIGTNDASKYQYIYNINGYIKEIILNGQPTYRFGYNNNGNINSMWEGGSTRSLDYDVGDRIQNSGTKKFKFDPDGFLIFRGDYSVNFNSKGQLTSISKPNQYRYFYFYDSSGRLVSMETNSGVMMQYFYSDITNPLRITHTYRYGLREEFTEYLYETDGLLLGMRRDGQQYYIATDPMGSPIAVFDFDGNLVKAMTYHPLGRKVKDTAPDFDLCFGFHGGLYNPETELVLLGKRVYDTDNGHWISPDYGATLNSLSKIPENPLLTNNYQYSQIINVERRQRKFPTLDVSDWLSVLGFDINSLVPDVSYTGEIRKGEDPSSYSLLPMSSAFECMFVQDMTNLMRMSVVPTSSVSPLISSKDLSPSAVPGILGNGVTVSYHNGKAIVRYASTAAQWSKQLAQVLINESFIIDLKHNIKGKDVHYLLKYDASKADDDIRILGLSNDQQPFSRYGINVTINPPELKTRFLSGRFQEVDIRLHGKYSVINIRYGSTVERELQRILNHSKERAVKHAWDMERWLIQNGLPSKYKRWTDDEKLQISTLGYAEGYKGHYIRSTDLYPELSDDCNNIRFIKDNR